MANSPPPYSPPRQPSAGERAGVAVLVAAAFGVGMLVGGQTCAPSPSSSQDDPEHASSTQERKCHEPRVVERVVESPPTVIYECPPEPPPEPKRGAGKKTLPEPEPEVDPLERRRLLAWVRDQSKDLETCRDDSKQIYRLAIIMHLDPKTRAVRRVDTNADRGDVPRETSSCIRSRIMKWSPPLDLATTRDRLVFGLNI